MVLSSPAIPWKEMAGMRDKLIHKEGIRKGALFWFYLKMTHLGHRIQDMC